MLSAEFFEKTYAGDRPGRLIDDDAEMLNGENYDGTDGRDNTNNLNLHSPRISKSSSSSPFDCAPTTVSPLSNRRAEVVYTTESRVQNSNIKCVQDHSPVTTNGPEMGRDGLRDFAIIVSKAYRHECSNENRAEHSKDYTKTRNNDERRIRTRTKQRSMRKASYSETHGNPDSQDQRFPQPLTINQKNTSVGVSSSLVDRRVETCKYQSSEDSPKGVDEITGKELFIRQQRKPSETIGLSIQDQIQLQDLYDEETRKNRDLKSIVSQLEVEISTLKISLANVPKGTKKKNENDSYKDSYRDKNLIIDHDTPHAQNSFLKREQRNSSPPPKLSEDFGVVVDDHVASNSSREIMAEGSLRKTQIQLEESKQVIQMLFKDLKISKQNELELKNKLNWSRLTQQKHQLRYEENMKIAMKSADDVRANLKKVERERAQKKSHSSIEITRVNKELMEVKNQCVRLKHQLKQAKGLAIHSEKHGMEDKATDRSEQLPYGEIDLEMAKISNVNIGLGVDSDGFRSSMESINHEDIASKPNRAFENMQSNGKEHSRSVAYMQHLPMVESTNFFEAYADVTPTQPMFVPKTLFPDEEIKKSDNIERLQIIDQAARYKRASSHSTSEARSSSISLDKENEHSNLSKRRLDFASCMEESDVVHDPRDAQNTISSTLRDCNGAQHSHGSKNATLNELMNELRASKKRLQQADEKLNELVNEEGLLSKLRKLKGPQVDGCFDIVNSLDDSIEVSHRRFANV
jgi:hypothetical protein